MVAGWLKLYKILALFLKRKIKIWYTWVFTFFLSLLYKDTSWSVDREGENEVGDQALIVHSEQYAQNSAQTLFSTSSLKKCLHVDTQHWLI